MEPLTVPPFHVFWLKLLSSILLLVACLQPRLLLPVWLLPMDAIVLQSVPWIASRGWRPRVLDLCPRVRPTPGPTSLVVTKQRTTRLVELPETQLQCVGDVGGWTEMYGRHNCRVPASKHAR